VKKKGKVKFTDHAKGYGYILSEDASDPAETLLFEAGDVSSEIDGLVPGTDVTFEVHPTGSASQARHVERA